MDPISAASFAATILTFVDFSAKLIKGTYEIYHSDGTAPENAQISMILEDLNDVTKNLQQDVKPDDPHRAFLRKLAGNCAEVSKELSELLTDLKRKEGNKVWRSFQAKWKSIASDKKVKSIENRLNSFRLELILRLSIIISEEQSSVESKLDEIEQRRLHHTSETVQELKSVQKAIRDLEDRLMDETSALMSKYNSEAMTNPMDEIRSALQTLLTKMEATVENPSIEASILKRLYFDSMFSRVDSIADAGFGTFDWLLNDNSVESQTSSEAGTGDQARGSISQEGEQRSSDVKNDYSIPRIEDQVKSREIPSVQITGVELQTVNEPNSSKAHRPSRGRSTSEESNDRDQQRQKSPSLVKNEDLSRRETRECFLNWVETRSRVFHVSGKAGSGKSTLMKHLSESERLKKGLELWAGDKKLIFASAFFWTSGAQEQRSLEGLYRSILFEILYQCPELVKEAFPTYFKRESPDISAWKDGPFRFSELNAAMNVVVSKRGFPNHRFCFFIDGLDEFEADNRLDHWDLVQNIQNWALSPDVKICVSSRPYEEFLQGFDPKLRMHLHKLTRGDVRRFIEGTLQNEPKLSYDSDGKLAGIIGDVVDRADGVFLWVRLVVRILVDGIRHFNPVGTLRTKMESLPRGLEPLFDELFDRIDSTDREMSDKLLLLMTYTGSSNALKISWLLDELDDAEFPYNRSMKPLLDDEILSRHERVRVQLDGLSKGLLEIRVTNPESWNGDQSGTIAEDIYYSHQVDFFHRTVADYLKEPDRQGAMQQRLGSIFDAASVEQRLKLAEFKFSRTKADYFRAQPLAQTSLVRSFYELWDRDYTYSEKFLNEIQEILNGHGQTPYTYPGETAENRGIIAWSQWWRSDEGSNDTLGDHISYLGWLIGTGPDDNVFGDYVIDRIRIDRNLVEHQEGLSFLFSACHSNKPRLVRFLLEEGMSPNEELDIRRSTGPHFETYYSETTTTWLAYSFSWAQVTIAQHEYPSTRRSRGDCKIMEHLLKFGADRDVHFLLQSKAEFARIEEEKLEEIRKRKTGVEGGQESNNETDVINDEADKASIKKDNSTCMPREEKQDDSKNDDYLVVSLECLLMHLRPQNLERLLGLLSQRKRTSVWWAGLRVAFSTTVGNFGKERVPRQKLEAFRHVQASEVKSMEGHYIVQAAYANGRCLEGDFAAGCF